MLLLGMLACNMQRAATTEPDLPGTITAQALTLAAPTGTAMATTETPAVGAVTYTPTKSSLPATAAPTDPPQPTKTPKPTKTREPAATATAAGPNDPEINLIETHACTEALINGEPYWIARLKVYWTDNSSDEDYFLLYRSTDLHPERQLVSAPPPNSTSLTFNVSYSQDDAVLDPYDVFSIAAYNAKGTSPGYTQHPVSRCTRAY
jgi:hypothetical protein